MRVRRQYESLRTSKEKKEKREKEKERKKKKEKEKRKEKSSKNLTRPSLSARSSLSPQGRRVGRDVPSLHNNTQCIRKSIGRG